MTKIDSLIPQMTFRENNSNNNNKRINKASLSFEGRCFVITNSPLNKVVTDILQYRVSVPALQ